MRLAGTPCPHSHLAGHQRRVFPVPARPGSAAGRRSGPPPLLLGFRPSRTPADSNMNTNVTRPAGLARPPRGPPADIRTIAFGLMAEPLDALASAPPTFEAQAARRILRDRFGLDAPLPRCR